ncbi:MAG TPA: hypothetical protein VGD43_19030 [Micromonospora sp.]
MGSREIVAVAWGLLLLLFLVKIYGVARYSLTTTAGLLVATPWQVALGTVAIYAYQVLPAVSLGTVWFAVLARDRLQWSAWPVVVIIAVVTALASPFKDLVRGLAVVAVALVVEVVLRRLLATSGGWVDRGNRRSMLRGLRGLSVVYLGAAVFAVRFLVSLQAPWVSAQAFKVDAPVVVSTQADAGQGGAPRFRVQVDDHFVGYPILEEEGLLTVLHAGTRHLVRIPSSAVRARITCHSEDDQLSGDRPLLEVLKGEPYRSPNYDCRAVLAYLRALKPGEEFRETP